MARKNIIGEKIRHTRKAANPKISQTDLAGRLQIQGLRIERATISKIETGNREVTDIEILAIAKALNVPISWLFDVND